MNFGVKENIIMFFTPETRIQYLNYRINLLNARDPSMNAKLIKALEREIRTLQHEVVNNESM